MIVALFQEVLKGFFYIRFVYRFHRSWFDVYREDRGQAVHQPGLTLCFYMDSFYCGFSERLVGFCRVLVVEIADVVQGERDQ